MDRKNAFSMVWLRHLVMKQCRHRRRPQKRLCAGTWCLARTLAALAAIAVLLGPARSSQAPGRHCDCFDDRARVLVTLNHKLTQIITKHTILHAQTQDNQHYLLASLEARNSVLAHGKPRTWKHSPAPRQIIARAPAARSIAKRRSAPRRRNRRPVPAQPFGRVSARRLAGEALHFLRCLDSVSHKKMLGISPSVRFFG